MYFCIFHLLFTSSTWATHLDLLLALNLAIMAVNKISKYKMYFEQPQIYYSTNILFLLNKNVFVFFFPQKNKLEKIASILFSKYHTLSIFPIIMSSGLNLHIMVIFILWFWWRHRAHARRVNVLTGKFNRKQKIINNSKLHMLCSNLTENRNERTLIFFWSDMFQLTFFN